MFLQPKRYLRMKQLWYGGIRSYLRYLADEDYQYLCQVRDSLSREIIIAFAKRHKPHEYGIFLL